MYQDSMRVQSVLQCDTYILSSCLRSWNAPLSITLIWLFSRCLWGKKNFIIQSIPAIQLQLTFIRSLEWLKWQLKELKVLVTSLCHNSDWYACRLSSWKPKQISLWFYEVCGCLSRPSFVSSMLVTTYRRVFSELPSILKTLSYFRALNIFQMHYKDSTSPWLFLVYISVSLNQGKRAVTRIGCTQPLNYIRHRIIQAILQKERQFGRKVPVKCTSAFWGYEWCF